MGLHQRSLPAAACSRACWGQRWLPMLAHMLLSGMPGAALLTNPDACFLQNEMEFLRIRSAKHEIMVAPSKHREHGGGPVCAVLRGRARPLWLATSFGIWSASMQAAAPQQHATQAVAC